MSTLKDLKVLILGIAAALLASMALIAALDATLVGLHERAPNEVVRMEPVTAVAHRPLRPTRTVRAPQVGAAAGRL